jgi:hypothetical protein
VIFGIAEIIGRSILRRLSQYTRQIDREPPWFFRQVLSRAAATVIVKASTLPMPMSSKAMTMRRRQIAVPFSWKNVSAARCAMSVSLRRMDFCRRLLTTQGSAAIGLVGRTQLEAISQASLCLAAPSASRMTFPKI